MQQVRKMMEKELKSDKYKSNSKGYVFTLMPLYAIGVGVFAVYKFIKIKSKDDAKIEKDKTVNGVKKSAETENQLNELEQRLAQTEKMLNSILTQLDPLTNCVKSVASEQKNEIMSQLQSIRHLMKKRGMDCPLMMAEEFPCEKNLEDVIDSLAAEEDHLSGSLSEGQERLLEEGTAEDGHLDGSEFEGEEGHKSTVSSWEATCGTNAVDEVTTSRDPKADSVVGLRRRNRPE
nr:coiled-coil domain-containing protein 107 isoform X2 [Paramormyrops kingsleyae]